MSEPMSTAGAGHGDVCYKAGQALFSLTLYFFQYTYSTKSKPRLVFLWKAFI